jgi:uncharacterized protein
MYSFPVAQSTLIELRSLGALIDTYEGSYQRLVRLAPDLDRLEGSMVSSVVGALDLYCTVLERSRYTTVLNLTYLFEDEFGQLVAEPNVRIGIYHDVRAVDVISHCRRKRASTVRPWRRGRKPELDRRWELNRFLYKWLGFCSRQGHLFLRCTSRRVDGLPTLR